ncbi:MAG: DNA mismatch endonuclease Vsr [Bryobacteraceae bacterium]
MDRSANMRAIRSKDMLPELRVRSLIHRLGYRFRLHRKDLPGKPDLVFAPRRKVVFVHGCFWHSHDCAIAHVPKSNRDYWQPKLQRTTNRDKRNVEALQAKGWQVLVIWECEVRDGGTLKKRIKQFLGVRPSPAGARRRK